MRLTRLSMLAAISPVYISSSPAMRSPPRLSAKSPPGASRTEQSSYFTTAAASNAGKKLKTRALARPSLSSAIDRITDNADPPVITRQKAARDVWDLSSDDLDPLVNKADSVLKRVKSKSAAKEKVAEKAKSKPKTKAIQMKKATEQGTIEGGKVTKPGARSRKTEKETMENRKSEDEEESLGLEKVMPRRRDWTPVKSRKTSFVNIDDLLESDEAGNGNFGDSAEQGATQTRSLQGLLGGFGYGPPPPEDTQCKPMELQPPLKRRKLDLIAATVPVKSLSAVTKKDKAPKKKALTITELATKDYMQVDNPLVQSASLMNTFLANKPTNGSPDAENETTGMPQVLDKSRRKTKATSKAAVKPKSRLLSPGRAMQATESQDLLFGTSSQLVREDSPSFIRDLQHALRESEASASQGIENESSRPASVGTKSLWSAAIRNTDGSLMEAEPVDLTKSTRSMTPKTPMAGAFHATMPVFSPPKIDFAMEASLVTEDVAAPSLPTFDEEELQVSLPKSVAEAACRSRPRSKSPTKKAKSRNSDEASTARSKKKDKSDFNNWTVVELAKQIKNYGFKPVKGKAAMVTLLEKCAESMQERQVVRAEGVQSPHFGPTDKETGTSATKSKSKSKTKATKGKAKSQEKEVIDVDSGEVSESALQAPGPFVRRAPAQSSKQVERQGISSPTVEETELLESITKAIKTFPPTYDMKNLSWYEKILMYDPIVLEDLTVWLNTEGLGRVNVDAEVWPALVRTWCETHSVCCLWRENLRGGKRARY